MSARSDAIIAKAGERVMDAETGEVICTVKNTILPYSAVVASDFHEFTEGNQPWVASQQMDARCTRPKESGGWQIFVEGEWR